MKRGDLPPGMFDDSLPSPARVFWPTNRHNLLKAMASRMLEPLEGHTGKYYDDLLRFAPGRIPLIAHGMALDLIPLVATEPTEIPVLIELDVQRIRDNLAPAFSAGSQAPGSARIGDQDWAAWAPPGPLPFSVVTQIHMRSTADLEEFALREFQDVRPVSELLTVSPELFHLDELGASRLENWLESLPSPADVGLDLIGSDRRGGALLLLTTTARRQHVALVVDLLNRRESDDESGAVRGLSTWILGGTLLGPDSEGRIVAAVLAEFSSNDRTKVWRPTGLTRSIRTRLALAADTDDVPLLELSFDRAEQILRSEISFEGFKAGGSVALKAMLLALLRPEPERFQAWDIGGDETDLDLRLLTAGFVGALNGRSRLPVSMRPAALDDFLSTWECVALASAESVTRPLPLVDYIGGPTVVTVKADGVVLQTLPEPLPQPVPAPLIETPEPKAQATIFDRPAARTAAIQFSIEQGWWDAVSTVIHVGAGSAQIDPDPNGGLVIHVEGKGQRAITQELREAAFMERIGDGVMPADVLDSLSGSQQLPVAKPRSRPRRAKGIQTE